RGGKVVRSPQDGQVVAPGGAQVHRASRSARTGKGGREVQQGAGGSTPPAVDRLVRIPHGGHRVTATEQRAQHLHLGDRGVLVLVQQHRPVPGPLPHADVLHLRGDRG